MPSPKFLFSKSYVDPRNVNFFKAPPVDSDSKSDL